MSGLLPVGPRGEEKEEEMKDRDRGARWSLSCPRPLKGLLPALGTLILLLSGSAGGAAGGTPGRRLPLRERGAACGPAAGFAVEPPFATPSF